MWQYPLCCSKVTSLPVLSWKPGEWGWVWWSQGERWTDTGGPFTIKCRAGWALQCCDSGIPRGAGRRAVLLPEALAMVDMPTVKTLPGAQAFDSTINLNGIFTVQRTGHFLIFLMHSPHFPCALVLGRGHGCSSPRGYFGFFKPSPYSPSAEIPFPIVPFKAITLEAAISFSSAVLAACPPSLS